MRRVALTQPKCEAGLKVGLETQHSRAGWDSVCMEKVLSIEVRWPWGCEGFTGAGGAVWAIGSRQLSQSLGFRRRPIFESYQFQTTEKLYYQLAKKGKETVDVTALPGFDSQGRFHRHQARAVAEVKHLRGKLPILVRYSAHRHVAP